MESAPATAGTNACCTAPDSLEEVSRKDDDAGQLMIVNQCKTCKRKHYLLSVAPIKMGIEGAPIGAAPSKEVPTIGAMLIKCDMTGTVTIECQGLTRSKEGLLSVLDAAREVVERMQ
jgi:hypothetical protein